MPSVTQSITVEPLFAKGSQVNLGAVISGVDIEHLTGKVQYIIAL